MQSLRRHGKSFFWASFFLPRKGREGAARLYAFCRALDDYADELPPDQARQILAEIQRDLLEDGTATPFGGEMRILERRFDVPRAAMLRLITALIEDSHPRRITRQGELLRYAYGVAGSVGLMMRPLLAAKDSQAIPFAVDLGVAMQLTNIARDVLEDARRDRRYLPSAPAPGHPPRGDELCPQSLIAGDPQTQAAAWRQIQAVLDLAACYYRSADRGMAFIPLRSRIAIVTAARIYEAIGTRILRLGRDHYWGRRVRIGPAGKIGGSFRGLIHGLGVSRPEHHDKNLHEAFADLLREDSGTGSDG